MLKSGCTVNIAALDIFKAFDRVSHYALFSKLLERKFPTQLIKILLSWLSKCFGRVKWNNKLSETFQIKAGVRQGGILSPLLFAIYIEDILTELKRKRKGCIIDGVFLGCFLYADDILLITHSVACLQSMLNICGSMAKEIDLKFNVLKSAILRIGKRFNVKCCDLTYWTCK